MSAQIAKVIGMNSAGALLHVEGLGDVKEYERDEWYTDESIKTFNKIAR